MAIVYKYQSGDQVQITNANFNCEGIIIDTWLTLHGEDYRSMGEEEPIEVYLVLILSDAEDVGFKNYLSTNNYDFEIICSNRVKNKRILKEKYGV